jgi:transposase
MEYVGIDLHKKGFTACVMDEKGLVSHTGGYQNNVGEVEKLLLEVHDPSFVIEATQNWMWMVRYFEKSGLPVTLAHPLRTKAIASARIKTDELDAKTLAHLLRSDLVPMAYIPTINEQEDRDLARARCQFVKQQTWIKNQIHSLLTKENLLSPVSDLFGKRGRIWLSKQDLTDNNKIIVKEFLDLLENVKEKIITLDKEIEKRSKANPRSEILKSIPGFGTITAFVLASEIGDPNRFPSGKKMAAYLGLVPSLYQSGNTKRLGSITKLGSPYARWVLMQAAHRLVRQDINTKLFYQTLSLRRGKKKAIVAVARKLTELSYRLLTDNRKYELRGMPKRD